ncbi:MAG: AmmeMemoRadiSam system protein A [Pseudomonadota bacterium]
MSTEQGKILLPIARAAIAGALGAPRVADESAPWLAEPGASFVTLTQHGGLRGCIGSLTPQRPLLEDVKGNAVAAALRDPRFPPLRLSELDITEVEISLLSDATPIHFDDEAHALAQLRPHVDGIIFEFAHLRSTFLPQVWESLPHPELFLAQLKRKAGLPSDFWAPGVKLLRYSVTKWKESDLAGQAA